LLHCEPIRSTRRSLHINGKTAEVDARPSDALALAALMGAPITVDDTLMTATGIAVSEAQIAMLGRGLDEQGAKLASEILASMSPPPIDEVERAYHELRALLTNKR